MNKIHKRRLYFVILFTLLLGAATGLILYALKQNINVFVTPRQIASAHIPVDYPFRLGGVVKSQSIKRDNGSLDVTFVITDLHKEVTVRYTGVLPDLFREGKGVIACGSLDRRGLFIATQILAKHDENYMPKNVYKAMREDLKHA